MKPTVLFAHGAGASSSSAWMAGWQRNLAEVGEVRAFDYAYMRAGKKLPDRLPSLVEQHLAEIDVVSRQPGAETLILAGKSMGGRVGCHASLERAVSGLICFGYPLFGVGKKRPCRDEVLRQLNTPILFVQGTRDKLCPLPELERVRAQMQVRSVVHVVEGGDHSLLVRKRDALSQEDADAEIMAAVRRFVEGRQ